MKKWIFLFVILMILAVVFGYRMYTEILENKTAGHDEAIEVATEEANLQEVIETSTYNRNETYIVVKGVDEDDTTVYVFVSDEEDKGVVIVDASTGISEDEALGLLRERQSVSRILSVQIGLEGGSAVWEITYIDTDDRLTYYYMDFQTGEYLGIRVL